MSANDQQNEWVSSFAKAMEGFHAGMQAASRVIIGALSSFGELMIENIPTEPESQAYEISGHTIIFTFYQRVTVAIIVSNSGEKGFAVAGAARCHPKDRYDREKGMRQAMRKACGVGYRYPGQDETLDNLYRSFRTFQRANGYEA